MDKDISHNNNPQIGDVFIGWGGRYLLVYDLDTDGFVLPVWLNVINWCNISMDIPNSFDYVGNFRGQTIAQICNNLQLENKALDKTMDCIKSGVVN